ncbi:hypothetical protein LVJ94_34835 [Pendulispora rubella]|uniref:Glycosyltransferase n=1 Tax=Pendulispora rubella TaxID=2741070 RepID=A0ABZ2KTS7_9BACT
MARPHVLLFYRNFNSQENPDCQCHIGLGVGALHTTNVLREHGVDIHPYGVWTPAQIRDRLRAHPACSHVVIEAPWVPIPELERLLGEFRNVRFAVRSHSNMSFLQVEAGAIRDIRQGLILEYSVPNFDIAANTKHLQHVLEQGYAGRCLYLPNLYDFERPRRRRPTAHDHRLLRIGSFGALRLLKMRTADATAAMLIARDRNCDLEFLISVERVENGKGVLDALRAMFAGLPWAHLKEIPWQPWGQFRHTIGHCDLHIQLSATETFNITSADAVAEGVPCLVSPAIEWMPPQFQVHADRAEDAARVGSQILSSWSAPDEQRDALEGYVDDGVDHWLGYFGTKRKKPYRATPPTRNPLPQRGPVPPLVR